MSKTSPTDSVHAAGSGSFYFISVTSQDKFTRNVKTFVVRASKQFYQLNLIIINSIMMDVSRENCLEMFGVCGI